MRRHHLSPEATHDVEPMSSTTASQEELKAHRVPIAWRDQCSAYVLLSLRIRVPPRTYAHTIFFSNGWVVFTSLLRACSLLLPLNVCRKEKYYLPWECENERHAYEKYVFIVVCFLFPPLISNTRPQMSIRRVSHHVLFVPIFHTSKCAVLSSYMRRMKVLSKQKLRERDAATDS